MSNINKVGSGVEISEHEDCYVLRVMKDADFGQSKSGKSVLKATTHGEVELPNGDFLNLNYYTKVKATKPVKTPKKKLEWTVNKGKIE